MLALGSRPWPWYGWLGLGLVAVFWTFNWSLRGLRTHWGFFPLWLGYCLTVDALVCLRRGSSMLQRSPLGFGLLFLVSAPAWWLFELFNRRTQNWFYQGAEYFTDTQYFLLCSLSFSTVMPAVFGSAELICTFRWMGRFDHGPVLSASRRTVAIFFVTGFLMLILLLAWPRYFFPFLWISVFLLLEPLNVLLKHPSLLASTARGDWRQVLSLSLGCLMCGFFWELWNYYSYPRWIYHVPFVDFLHVFEMPLLGYVGYLVFPWELFALYFLVTGVLGSRSLRVLIDRCEEHGGEA
jgi:hypothetical protein